MLKKIRHSCTDQKPNEWWIERRGGSGYFGRLLTRLKQSWKRKFLISVEKCKIVIILRHSLYGSPRLYSKSTPGTASQICFKSLTKKCTSPSGSKGHIIWYIRDGWLLEENKEPGTMIGNKPSKPPFQPHFNLKVLFSPPELVIPRSMWAARRLFRCECECVCIPETWKEALKMTGLLE